MSDEYCFAEHCRYRHWQSGSMPTHRRGDTCPKEYTPARDMVLEGYARAPFELNIWDYEVGQSFTERKQAARRRLAAEIRRAKAEALREAAEALTLPYGCELLPDGSEDFRAGVAVEVNGEFVQELRHRADQIEGHQ